MISSNFIFACGDVLKVYYNNKTLLCSSGKPKKLRAISFNREFTGNDLLNLITYEEVRLAINLTQNFLYREWALMKQYYIKAKPINFLDNNVICDGIQKSLLYFAHILKYIIDNDIFSYINNDQDFRYQYEKIKDYIQREKPDLTGFKRIF